MKLVIKGTKVSPVGYWGCPFCRSVCLVTQDNDPDIIRHDASTPSITVRCPTCKIERDLIPISPEAARRMISQYTPITEG